MSRTSPFRAIRSGPRPLNPLDRLKLRVALMATREEYEGFLAQCKHPDRVRELTEPMLRPSLRLRICDHCGEPDPNEDHHDGWSSDLPHGGWMCQPARKGAAKFAMPEAE